MLRRVQRMRASVGMRALFLEQSFETCACVVVVLLLLLLFGQGNNNNNKSLSKKKKYLVPYARATARVNVLRVYFRIQELDDAFSLRLVDAHRVVCFHGKGPRYQRQAFPDLYRADERKIAREICAAETQERDE